MDDMSVFSQAVADSVTQIEEIKTALKYEVNELLNRKNKKMFDCTYDGHLDNVKGLLHDLDGINVTVGDLRMTGIGKVLTKYQKDLPMALSSIANKVNDKWKVMLQKYRERLKNTLNVKKSQTLSPNSDDQNAVKIVRNDGSVIQLLDKNKNNSSTADMKQNTTGQENALSTSLTFLEHVKDSIGVAMNRVNTVERDCAVIKNSMEDILQKIKSYEKDVYSFFDNNSSQKQEMIDDKCVPNGRNGKATKSICSVDDVIDVDSGDDSLTLSNTSDSILPTTTPTNYVKATTTPTNYVKATTTPTNYVKATTTPTSYVKATKTPTNNVKAAKTPTNYVKATTTPTNYVKATKTPKNCVNATTTPTNYVKATTTPTNYVKATTTPTSSVNLVDFSREEIYHNKKNSIGGRCSPENSKSLQRDSSLRNDNNILDEQETVGRKRKRSVGEKTTSEINKRSESVLKDVSQRSVTGVSNLRTTTKIKIKALQDESLKNVFNKIPLTPDKIGEACRLKKTYGSNKEPSKSCSGKNSPSISDIPILKNVKKEVIDEPERTAEASFSFEYCKNLLQQAGDQSILHAGQSEFGTKKRKNHTKTSHDVTTPSSQHNHGKTVSDVDGEGFKVPVVMSQYTAENNVNPSLIVKGELISESQAGIELEDVELESFLSYSQAVDDMEDDIEEDEREYLLQNKQKKRQSWNNYCKKKEGVKYAPLVKNKGRMKAAHKSSIGKKAIQTLLDKRNKSSMNSTLDT